MKEYKTPKADFVSFCYKEQIAASGTGCYLSQFINGTANCHTMKYDGCDTFSGTFEEAISYAAQNRYWVDNVS